MVSPVLCGKVAVVTASTNGIGYAIAERLAREGAKVLVSSRKRENVDAAVKQLRNQGFDVNGQVCHVGKQQDRDALFKAAASLGTTGGIDILVSNAGTNPTVGPVLDCEEAVWDKIFEINVKSSFLLAKEVLPYMRKQPYGRIIFISSIAGYNPFELLGAYSVSKTALLGLTKAAAAQLAAENITVNCIAPGIIQTKFSKFLVETPEAREAALSFIPMKRFGVPADIGGTAAFLASKDSSYITGETILITGGMPARL